MESIKENGTSEIKTEDDKLSSEQMNGVDKAVEQTNANVENGKIVDLNSKSDESNAPNGEPLVEEAQECRSEQVVKERPDENHVEANKVKIKEQEIKAEIKLNNVDSNARSTDDKCSIIEPTETKKTENEKSDVKASSKADGKNMLVELLKEIKSEKPVKDQRKANQRATATKIPEFKDIQIKIEENLENLRVENKELTFEECLENGRQMMIRFLDNQFEEVIGILEKQSEISIIHKLGSAAVRFFDSILSMDKEKIAIALTAMREAADYADKHRKKTGYISYLISPDYNTFNDVECHAELCYATTMLVSGLLIALEDQSIYGFVNGGLKIRMAHSSFKECNNIFKNKFNWESNVARMHFESGTRLGIGSFDLIISFFPTKLAKLLEYIGFNSDRDQAIEELTQAVSLVDGLYYDISSILLSAYYGFLEYFYGLGESDTDFFDKSSIIWLTRTPNSSVVRIGLGVREMMLGQPDKAIVHFNECINGQSFWIQLHHACNWEICWSYV